jgi:LysM repeat protein
MATPWYYPNIPPEAPQRSRGLPQRDGAGPTRPSRPARPAQTGLSPSAVLSLGGCAFVLALIPAVLLLGLYLIFEAFGMVMPGVRIGQLAVGGLTERAAAASLDKTFNQRQLVATDGKRAWAATPADFGLWLDPQATARQAFLLGRGSSSAGELLQMLIGRSLGANPVVTFDPERAHASLANWVGLVNQAPVDASLQYDKGKWQSVPGRNGYTLDVNGTLAAIGADPGAVMLSGFLPLKLVPTPPKVADLTPALGRLQGQLDHPLKLQAYDPISDELSDWEVPAETLAGLIKVESASGEVRATLDQGKFKAYLVQWQASLGDGKTAEPGDLKHLSSDWQAGKVITVVVHYPPTDYVVQRGDTLLSISYEQGMMAWKILQANPDLEPNLLGTGQIITIPSKSDLLPLPVVIGKRIVISITEQKLWTYENSKQRHEYVISTGIKSSPTQPGVFQVQTHEPNAYASKWDLTMPNFLGIYEAGPDFMNGIHGLPMLSSGVRLWANVLGQPASYGCIILSLDDAEALYNWAEDGVVVEIKP